MVSFIGFVERGALVGGITLWGRLVVVGIESACRGYEVQRAHVNKPELGPANKEAERR